MLTRISILLSALTFSVWAHTASAAQSISVSDDLGNVIHLSRPARRVVALAPHLVENAYSAGAGSTLVAAVNYSNYPEQAKALPQLGSATGFSIEAVLAQAPDLVLAWGSGNGTEKIAQIRALGIPVYVSEPTSIARLGDSLRDIGALTGSKDIAEQKAQQFEQQLKKLAARYEHQTIVSVFYQIWFKPLQTLGGPHWISDVLSLCGGQNIFQQERAIAPRISIESVLQHNPEVILSSVSSDANPKQSWKSDWHNWPALQAVRKQQLYDIHPDLIQRPTLRVLEGTKLICELLDTVREQRKGAEAGLD